MKVHHDIKMEFASNTDLLPAIRQSLLQYRERDRDIIQRRMGLDRPAQTLQQIADIYSLTREGVRKIANRLVTKLKRLEYRDDLLVRKLEELMHDRQYPLPTLGVEAIDPWFKGVGEYPSILQYVLENLCDDAANIISIDGVKYIAFLDQNCWDNILKSAQQILIGGADQHWTEYNCQSVVAWLLPENMRDLRQILWEKASANCNFAMSADGVRVLSSFGKAAEQVVAAILDESPHPIHFTKIAELAANRTGRAIDVRRAHNAAAAVGLLFGRGICGTDGHLPINQIQIMELAAEAEEIVSDGASDRQWHTSEILSSLIEKGSHLGDLFGKFVIDISLQRSGVLLKLGRMMWTARSEREDSSSSRI